MSEISPGFLGKYCQMESGYAFKSERFTESPDDICLVKGSNLGHRVIDWENGPKWPEKEFDSLKRYELVPGDIVIAMDRPVVGGNLKFAWIKVDDPKSLLVQRVARLRSHNGLDQGYLRCVIADPVFKAYIETITTGVNVPHISGPDMRRYRFPIPPLPTQQKIAYILSAYDDLIENNLKRIKLLEEMAQITYEQWFVRMKFPGHETTPIDAETGLPEGWESKELREFGEVVTGKTPSTSIEENYGDDVLFIKTPDMAKAPYVLESELQLSKKGAESQKGKYLPKNSLLVSCIGTAGVVALTGNDCQFNQQINAIKFTRESDAFFLYGFAKHLKPLLEALGSNGATMTNVNKTKFEKIRVVTPTDNLLEEFGERFKTHFINIENLLKQNQYLKEARDILLPRLMTGMINVDHIELPMPKEVTEAA